jgi:hypothetical protein
MEFATAVVGGEAPPVGWPDAGGTWVAGECPIVSQVEIRAICAPKGRLNVAALSRCRR